jgi:hypothetical protein
MSHASGWASEDRTCPWQDKWRDGYRFRTVQINVYQTPGRWPHEHADILLNAVKKLRDIGVVDYTKLPIVSGRSLCLEWDWDWIPAAVDIRASYVEGVHARASAARRNCASIAHVRGVAADSKIVRATSSETSVSASATLTTKSRSRMPLAMLRAMQKI